ncbi:hypothetical protein IWW34DRAFT_767774 [Fusarium oxysporum f. sp. albedinis]|nr:hypothetical protein IWW34DRAFT_767774 [Fusarium oxysporum f. sp. albedinis]
MCMWAMIRPQFSCLSSPTIPMLVTWERAGRKRGRKKGRKRGRREGIEEGRREGREEGRREEREEVVNILILEPLILY